jgi:hypothetical protein
MTTDKVQVKFTCKECGGTVIELPDNHTDDSIAKCKGCGIEFGRWGDIKAKSVGLVKQQVIADFKNAFKGKKGWKVK